jgi:hypothetical protein
MSTADEALDSYTDTMGNMLALPHLALKKLHRAALL